MFRSFWKISSLFFRSSFFSFFFSFPFSLHSLAISSNLGLEPAPRGQEPGKKAMAKRPETHEIIHISYHLIFFLVLKFWLLKIQEKKIWLRYPLISYHGNYSFSQAKQSQSWSWMPDRFPRFSSFDLRWRTSRGGSHSQNKVYLIKFFVGLFLGKIIRFGRFEPTKYLCKFRVHIFLYNFLD